MHNCVWEVLENEKVLVINIGNNKAYGIEEMGDEVSDEILHQCNDYQLTESVKELRLKINSIFNR